MRPAVKYAIALAFIVLLAAVLLPGIHTGGPVPVAQCRTELLNIGSALSAYQNDQGILPSGDTQSILKILAGENPQKKVYLNFARKPGRGEFEFIDPWGTPYQIEIGERTNYFIGSAGKNRKFGDKDDFALDNATGSGSQQTK